MCLDIGDKRKRNLSYERNTKCLKNHKINELSLISH